MKRTYIFLPALFILFNCAVNTQAQEGPGNAWGREEVPPFAIGLRATPDGAGISGKFFFIDRVCAEAQINGSDGPNYGNYPYGSSASLVGLVEYNFIFPDVGFRIFLGPGAHVASWKQYADNTVPRQVVYGLDAIAGAEYVFDDVPIGISIDVKPAMNFLNGVTDFPNNTFGLGVRYYFGDWDKKQTGPDGEKR